jgi:hypothetical protein
MNSGGYAESARPPATCRVNSPSGDIVVQRAYGALTAKTASGAIRVGEAFLHTCAGNREVGIRESTAGQLDVNAMAGNVRNELGTADGPQRRPSRSSRLAHTNTGDMVLPVSARRLRRTHKNNEDRKRNHDQCEVDRHDAG